MTVDISSAQFQVPVSASSNPVSPLYAPVKTVDVTTLTSGATDGTGIFDKLMQGVAAQLQGEFEAGRITGGDYTKAYIELTQAALANSVQFALGSQQAFWSAQTAQIQAMTGMIQVETARYTYQNILPMQASLVTEQANAQRGQTSDTRLDGTSIAGVMGTQKSLYGQQIISYQRDAECKAAKFFTDAWITQKTIDDGLVPPNGFTNTTVNTVLNKIMQANNFGTC